MPIDVHDVGAPCHCALDANIYLCIIFSLQKVLSKFSKWIMGLILCSGKIHEQGNSFVQAMPISL
jgi:hypothetical protein